MGSRVFVLGATYVCSFSFACTKENEPKEKYATSEDNHSAPDGAFLPHGPHGLSTPDVDLPPRCLLVFLLLYMFSESGYCLEDEVGDYYFINEIKRIDRE